MTGEQQQQQQQQQLNHGVVDGIERLEDPYYRQRRHTLIVDGYNKPRINRQSLDHLFSFLGDTDSHEVTELKLLSVHLDPSDGSLDVLRDFFARSETTLTKVYLSACNFGTAEDASRLLAAFQTNRTVTDLTICRISNLRGAALAACLSSLVLNMHQLHRLDCTGCALRVEGAHAFQPALQANRTPKKLILAECQLGDEGIRLIADAMVGSTIMKLLDISGNVITSAGLANITRLLESTQLKTIDIGNNYGVFDNTNATQHFISTLQHKNASVQELPSIEFYFPVNVREATYASIKNSLTRNQQLNRVNLLLAPPPPPPQQQRNTSTMLLKTWHQAITKFAMVPNNAGASAIFKLFQARPALLEKRIKRPAATVSRRHQDPSSLHDGGNESKSDGAANNLLGGQKCRRL